MRVIICFVALLAAALGFSQVDPFQITWSPFLSGTQSDIRSQREEVINSENEFQAFWMKLTGQPANTTPRGINWTREMLIAIVLGERPTLGYGVRVVSIDRPTAATTMIRWTELVPRGGVQGQAKSSPWVIVKLNRPGGTYEFAKIGTESVGGSGGRPGGGTGRLYWRTYKAGTNSRLNAEAGVAANGQPEFTKMWRDVTGDLSPPRDIDWDSETLVLINLGRRASDGFDVWIESISRTRDGVEVKYVERRPSRDQHVKREPTVPYIFVRVTKFDGRITFTGRRWNSDSGG